MSKKITPIDVVKFFLKLSEYDNDSGDILTNLKAQKLLYYAQGVSLGKTGKPLFDDDFVAWIHGPVIPSVYEELKNFGRSQIELKDDLDIDKFTDEQIDLLISVYKTYGQYSAWKLREMTHHEAPWRNVKTNEVISKASIEDYFSKELVTA